MGMGYRHDNDRRHPRTTKEIYQLNRAVAKKMWDIFGSRGIPAVPSLGAFLLRLPIVRLEEA